MTLTRGLAPLPLVCALALAGCGAQSCSRSAPAAAATSGPLLITDRGLGPLRWNESLSLDAFQRLLPDYDVSEERCQGRTGDFCRAPLELWARAPGSKKNPDGGRSGVEVALDPSTRRVLDASANSPDVQSADGLRPGSEVTFALEPPAAPGAVDYQGAARTPSHALRGVTCKATKLGKAPLLLDCPLASERHVRAYFYDVGPSPSGAEGTFRLLTFVYASDASAWAVSARNPPALPAPPDPSLLTPAGRREPATTRAGVTFAAAPEAHRTPSAAALARPLAVAGVVRNH